MSTDRVKQGPNSGPIRKFKPKNAKSKRALVEMEPKVHENVKKAVFLRGTRTSPSVEMALKDLYALKKPEAILMSRKNEIHPFEAGKSESTLEFMSLKNDAAFVLTGTHSKKRPDTLTIARMFDHHISDMVELHINAETARGVATFVSEKIDTCTQGARPTFIFSGDVFDSVERARVVKNMLLDLYCGQESKECDIESLEYVIMVAATIEPSKVDSQPGILRLYLRTYRITKMKKIGNVDSERKGSAELVEMGPRMDLTVGRIRYASTELTKMAFKLPKELAPKKIKNIKHDEFTGKTGRIHLGKQDVTKIQTRKLKGLKE